MSELLRLENIYFSYEKEPVLENLSYTFNEGETVFVGGSSGRGKSTFLNLMSGFLVPTGGSIYFKDQCISSLERRKRDSFRAKHTGIIYQGLNLINYLSAYENIELSLIISKHQSSKDIYEIAKRLQIVEYLDKKPDELSVGQQQRVAIARALIGHPEIILADEPTSSLDENSTHQMLELLFEEQKKSNFLLIFVSHDNSLKRFFNRVIDL